MLNYFGSYRHKLYLRSLLLTVAFSGLTACSTQNIFTSSPQKAHPAYHVEASKEHPNKAKHYKAKSSTVVARKADNDSRKEFFPKSQYGVEASPRVADADQQIPRGGGRFHVGKPYKIGDRWYHPQETPKEQEVGLASWYGDAFHGRLTANGEIYDKEHLTAAHPTMPLPSYVRVTNIDNGTSITVRVNDRGPFSKGRVIDLSEGAARMLGYIDKGTANVKLEYLGTAPLEGDDKPYLLASYDGGDASNSMFASAQDTLEDISDSNNEVMIVGATKNIDNEIILPAEVPKPSNHPIYAKARDISIRPDKDLNGITKVTLISKVKY